MFQMFRNFVKIFQTCSIKELMNLLVWLERVSFYGYLLAQTLLCAYMYASRITLLIINRVHVAEKLAE